MNLSTAFPQQQWDGKSPFEVCSAPGGRQAQMTCTGAGALAKGGDLAVANATMTDAVAWCNSHPLCVGFTAKASGCTDTVGTVRHVYYKKAVTGHNPDAEWVSYVKRTPCAYDSEVEGWAAAEAVHLEGDTVVLSGVPNTTIAVRSHWRIYPCEHLQCGLYSKAEGLPPPPFYSLLV